jgi:hypothetical protein
VKPVESIGPDAVTEAEGVGDLCREITEETFRDLDRSEAGEPFAGDSVVTDDGDRVAAPGAFQRRFVLGV